MTHQAPTETTAQALVAEGKGILAADESNGTMDKRLAPVLDTEPTEEDRRAFRELLFTTAGAESHISGAILYDETIRQSAGDGTPFPELLSRQGIIPGIKVDTGAKPLAASPGEKVTEGLDGLRERLEEYHALGARFAKWRAVIAIGDGLPTSRCIEVNAHALARYAALCQEADITPIVEPEVLMDGDHTIDTCDEVTQRTLRAVFVALDAQGVVLEGMILKPNMVLSGTDCPDQAGVDEVADRTLRCLRRVVPAAVPGITFLSGGQSDEAATAHLDAMNRIGGQPWELSFSYGRALQATPLAAWRGQASKAADAQGAYLELAQANGAARRGRYESEHAVAPAA
ncbi:MAG: fructose-bisphosphate aldolase class I [Solirubrobacterales bacterium]|nr:fructose-bisphosphate aldolase class I [Solirubrobacterales bacterium]